MQILIARLTADSKVNLLKDGRQVTNFSIALNSSFKTKEGELKKTTTYVSCAYWINSNIAKILTKGTLVELGGSIGVNIYTDRRGEAKFTLTFHVNQIKFPGHPDAHKIIPVSVQQPADQEPIVEDLPF